MFLVLSRKLNQDVIIDGRIIVRVVAIEAGKVRLGIAAPKEMTVNRREVHNQKTRDERRNLGATWPPPVTGSGEGLS